MDNERKKVDPCIGLLVLAACIFSMYASFSCNFISSEAKYLLDNNNAYPEGYNDGTTVNQGFWNFEAELEDKGCKGYNDEWKNHFGKSWPSQVTAARIFTIITTIVGTVMVAIGVLMVCRNFPPEMFCCFGIYFFVQGLSEILKFVFLIDKKEYTLESGAYCCIVSSFLWFICMCIAFSVNRFWENPSKFGPGAKVQTGSNEKCTEACSSKNSAENSAQVGHSFTVQLPTRFIIPSSPWDPAITDSTKISDIKELIAAEAGGGMYSADRQHLLKEDVCIDDGKELKSYFSDENDALALCLLEGDAQTGSGFVRLRTSTPPEGSQGNSGGNGGQNQGS